jgi:hypothetical protein
MLIVVIFFLSTGVSLVAAKRRMSGFKSKEITTLAAALVVSLPGLRLYTLHLIRLVPA